jgi:hypothetical protein
MAIIADDMKSLFLNILLGVSVFCGNCHASSDSQGGSHSDQDPSWLHCWKSIEDVNRFFDYVENQRKAGVDVELNLDNSVVNNTVATNDRFATLCILTNAFYSVDINGLESQISAALGNIIRETRIPCPCVDQDLWGNPGLYDICWAWLLFCSQIDSCDEKALKSGYNIYPISVAKELLGRQKNGLAIIARKILKKIETLVP